MIIGFTGTRLGMTSGQVWKCATLIGENSPFTVIHGDCVGADRQFEWICQSWAMRSYCFDRLDEPLRVLIYPGHSKLEPPPELQENFDLEFPDSGDVVVRYEYLPARPHLERNRKIVNQCDLLLACPHESTKKTKRGGTWYTIGFAQELGREVVIL